MLRSLFVVAAVTILFADVGFTPRIETSQASALVQVPVVEHEALTVHASPEPTPVAQIQKETPKRKAEPQKIGAVLEKAAAAAASVPPPPTPTVGATTAPTVAPRRYADTSSRIPVHVSIPSVGIESRVIKVGVDAKGQMAVPDGSTNDVGWYKGGTVPGDVGSAVLDAHVYAAFEDLRDVHVGDDIYLVTEGGATQHFRVEQSTVYKLSDLTPAMLFERRDARRLNLITCAGAYVDSMGTYTHRLVVYAVYIGTV
jgi:sortase (surface protein transpeptidase)